MTAEQLIRKQLNKIYITCKSVAKSWRSKGVNIGVLSHIIKMSKFGDDSEVDAEFKTAYNSMLDELLKTCSQQSIGNTVSFKDLRNNIEIMKRGVSKGIVK